MVLSQIDTMSRTQAIQTNFYQLDDDKKPKDDKTKDSLIPAEINDDVEKLEETLTTCQKKLEDAKKNQKAFTFEFTSTELAGTVGTGSWDKTFKCENGKVVSIDPNLLLSADGKTITKDNRGMMTSTVNANAALKKANELIEVKKTALANDIEKLETEEEQLTDRIKELKGENDSEGYTLWSCVMWPVNLIKNCFSWIWNCITCNYGSSEEPKNEDETK